MPPTENHLMYDQLAVIAVFTFCYSLVSGRVARLPISGPLLFVLVGLAVGPLGLGWLSTGVSSVTFRSLVEITLALVLFTDAANANTAKLRHPVRLPARMLLLGLPGTIVLGLGAGLLLFPHLTVYEAGILATMLAATDAALGKAVVTNEVVPARLREALNVESGLNDGLCVPILLVFIALEQGATRPGSSFGLQLAAREIGIGLLVGLTVAGAGVWAFRQCISRGWVNDVWVQLSVPALALACFAVAQTAHGSGYIAAFGGGLLFGRSLKKAAHPLVVPGEGVGEALAMLTWLIFGAGVIGQSMRHFTWDIVAYAVLSLTVIRMLPVFLSLVGSGESARDRLFLGWFGPRGLASIVFAIIVLEESLPGSEFMVLVVACTVGLSLVVHGISANPLASGIAREPG